MPRLLHGAITLAVLLLVATTGACESQETHRLEIRGHVFMVEIADDPAAQQQGLMFREELGPDEGMLFVYESPRRMSFWMRNTLIPLSIAFIDENYLITQIEDMEPLSEESVPSRDRVQYALEVNQGRFEELGIQPGDRVRMPQEVRMSQPAR